MKAYEEWIRDHLPKDIPSDLISRGIDTGLGGCYTVGLTVYCQGDRGPDTVVFTASSQDELRIWAFKKAASGIAQMMEMRRRLQNELKWRYVRDHAEGGKWLYTEHSRYQYNTIEDFRLDWFETYLRLIKGVLTSSQWEKEVKERIKLINNHYGKPHWDYDRKKMMFIEISDSKYVSQGVEEPTPGSIIRKL